MGNGSCECRECRLAAADAGINEVLAKRESVFCCIAETSSFHHSYATGILVLFTFPCHLKLEAALLQELAHLLGILQLVGTADTGKVGVGVIALQLNHLTVLSVAEEDEFESVESQDGRLVFNLCLHATLEVVEQFCTVKRP